MKWTSLNMPWAGKIALLVLLALASACTVRIDNTGSVTTVSVNPPAVGYVTPTILSIRQRDPSRFTQGLFLHNGYFYESYGLYGQSGLRKVDPVTGQTLQSVDVPANVFAEGITLVNDKIIQITWQTGVAYVYNADTLEKVGEFTYSGEGWGICFDGKALYMSDGSPILAVRDPNTFAVQREVTVTLHGEPVNQLNELECVGNAVYANVWYQNYIVKIDKTSGQVIAFINADDLVNIEAGSKQIRDSQAVLNGIAYDPARGVFYLTGKLWNNLFEVRLDEN